MTGIVITGDQRPAVTIDSSGRVTVASVSAQGPGGSPGLDAGQAAAILAAAQAAAAQASAAQAATALAASTRTGPRRRGIFYGMYGADGRIIRGWFPDGSPIPVRVVPRVGPRRRGILRGTWGSDGRLIEGTGPSGAPISADGDFNDPLPAYTPSPTVLAADPLYNLLSNPAAFFCIPVIGSQSNGWGYNGSSDTILSATAVYPSLAFMPAGGVRAAYSRAAGMTSLVESAAVANGRETPCSGMVNHFIACVKTYVGATLNPRVLTFNCSIAGRSINRLGRGSDQYAQFLSSLTEWAAWCRQNGYTPIMPAYAQVQGEADNTMSPAQRAAAQRLFVRQVAADAMAITKQTFPPICVYTQIRGGSAYSNTTAGDVSAEPFNPEWAAIEQGRLHGDYLLRCAGPYYPFPLYDTGGGTTDVQHLSSLGQLRQGRMLGRAIFEELCGFGYTPVLIDERGCRWLSPRKLRMATTASSHLQISTADCAATTLSIAGLQALGNRTQTLWGKTSTDFTLSIPVQGSDPNAGNPPGLDYPNRFLDLTWPADVTESITVAVGLRKESTTNGPIFGGRTLICDSSADHALDAEATALIDAGKTYNRYLGHALFQVCAP